MRSSTLFVKLYRFFLLAYPPEFQADCATEMVETLRVREAEVGRRSGFMSMLRFRFKELRAVIRTGLRLRLAREPMTTTERSLSRRRPAGSPPADRRRGGAWRGAFGQLPRDVRHALRGLLARPAFTAVIVLTLGLGIGVNSAIFNVIHWLVFQPLRVTAIEELVNIYALNSTGYGYSPLSTREFEELERRDDLFDGTVGYTTMLAALSGAEGAQTVSGEYVVGDYFAAAGYPFLLGRGFSPQEWREQGVHPVTVIGYSLWERRFENDPRVVGRQITVNGKHLTIVGVAPAEFGGLASPFARTEIWLPTAIANDVGFGYVSIGEADYGSQALERLQVKARRHPGFSVDRVNSALAVISRNLADEYPAEFAEASEERTLFAVPTEDVLVHPMATPLIYAAIVFFLSLVGLVLLIACTNIANLMLARVSARRQEIALRAALGAGRWRLLQQFVTESLVLSASGGLVGVLLAYWLAKLLVATFPQEPESFMVMPPIGIDSSTLIYTAVLCLGSAVVFGLVPALHATRNASGLSLQESGLQGRRPSRLGLRNFFLLPQVSLTLLFLVVAGLLARTIGNVAEEDLGFDANSSSMIMLDLGASEYTEAEARAFFGRLSGRVSEIPGVTSTAASNFVPLSGGGNSASILIGERELEANAGAVGVQFFEVLGTRLLRGRAFAEVDYAAGSAVVMINEAAAQLAWPGEDAIGKRFRWGGEDGPLWEVVGVVGNAKVSVRWESPKPFVYRPIVPGGLAEQQGWSGYAAPMALIARTGRSPAELVPLLPRVVHELDPDAVVLTSTTMHENADQMLYPYQMASGFAASLGFFGLLLATVGIFGVMAYGVARRTREIGVRVALGASGRDVIAMVVRDGMRTVAIGLVIGLGLSLIASRLLNGLMFGIDPIDPVACVLIPLAFAAVSLLAAYLPARRAARVDPMTALRSD